MTSTPLAVRPALLLGVPNQITLIRTVIAMEPFVSVAVEPTKEFTWKSTYNYYTLPASAK